MFDLGWSETIIILIVALVVIGPKDLPRVAREIGRWTGKARAMARDFHRAFDDMARESELDDLKKTVEGARNLNPKRKLAEAIDPDGSLSKSLTIKDEDDDERASKKPGAKPSSPSAKPALANGSAGDGEGGAVAFEAPEAPKPEREKVAAGGGKAGEN